MRNKSTLGWLAIAGAVIAAAVGFGPPAPPPAASQAGSAARAQAQAIESPLAMPLHRGTLGAPAGDLFSSWVPPAPVAPAAPALAAQPAAPPLPYRVAGRVVVDGKQRIVLAQGDRVFTVSAGEVLEGGYRVESVQPDRITLLYVPLGVQTTLPLEFTMDIAIAPQSPPAPSPLASRPTAAASAASRPAELRWEGPERVRLGNTFDVVLKVTSEEPVRGSPFQLAFTADLLEPVAVRPGTFYAGGNFSYRINPKGYITVGASRSESVASDAEFLVLTFKSVRAGAIAEVKVSSVVLQGASGAAIAHDQPGLFRTAIE